MSGVARATSLHHRPLPQRGTPCLAKLTRTRKWAGTIAVLVDDVAVGIRYDSTRTCERIEKSLTLERLPEADEEVAPNFSVELPYSPSNAVRRFNVVYEDHNLVARRTNAEDLMRDLTDLVTATRNRNETGMLAIHATAVLRPDRSVVLFPPSWHHTLVLHRDRLSAQGLEVLTTHRHLLRAPGSDGGPHATVLRTSVGGTTLDATVGLWGVKAPDMASGTVRPGQAVVKTFGYVENRQVIGAGMVLEDLAAITSKTPVVAVDALSGMTLVRSVVDLAQTCGPVSTDLASRT